MALTDSPSSGHSEVLAVLKIAGRSVLFSRLCERTAHDWGYYGQTPSAYRTSVGAVLSALQTAGYVTAADDDGDVVDLTSGTPPDATMIVLTVSGRVNARHPRPRPFKSPT